jgi:hypothetical protein
VHDNRILLLWSASFGLTPSTFRRRTRLSAVDRGRLEVGRALFGLSLTGIDRVARPATDPESKIAAIIDRPFRINGRNGGGYDLAVVGAGSVGFSAAITAAEQGAQVALIGTAPLVAPASISGTSHQRP